MERATGLAPRRGRMLDAETVLVGEVMAGARGRMAETRTGAARMLTTNLTAQEVFKAMVYGQTENAAGGYLIQVGHVPLGGELADATGYVTVAEVIANGQSIDEVPISGASMWAALRESASLTTEDSRGVAIRAIPGTGNLAITNVALTSNVATVTVGSHTIAVGDVVEVKNCSDGTFNGTFTITAKSSTTISFAKTHANVSSASATGTVTNGVAAPVGTMMITLQPSY